MNILNELTVKNLKRNKKRTLVTIFGIILSVAGYGDYDICFQHAGLYDRVRKGK